MSEDSELQERLVLLEETVTGMKRVGVLLAVLLCVLAGTLVSQNSSIRSALETDSVILTESGTRRAALTSMPTGHVALVFYDFEENLPETLDSDTLPYFEGLVFYDRFGKPRLTLGIDDTGTPVIDALTPEGEKIFSAVPKSEQPLAAPDQSASSEEASVADDGSETPQTD